jgi:MoaA/NifB/PqqE/SkfB family radical SAM enzyme
MDLKNKAQLGFSVLRYKLTGKRIPVAVAWLITGRCNLQCCYCKWKDQRRSEELDTAAAKDMIDQMKRAGVRLISFTGGEPLVRSDIGQIIHHVKDSGLVCKLNTNGMLVESRLDDLRRLDLLQISVDGPPDIQDRLRGEGTSEKAARAIELARNAGIRVQLIACLTRDNVLRLDEVLDYGLELGVGFCFQLLTPKELDDKAADESMPDKDRLIESLEYLVRLRKERNPRAAAIASKDAELDYYIDLLKNGSPGCQCTLVTATMMPDGRLIFCGNAKNIESYDAVELGFAEAFSRLTIPDCDGCVCVGKLRLSKVYQFDPSILKEMLGLWR